LIVDDPDGNRLLFFDSYPQPRQNLPAATRDHA